MKKILVLILLLTTSFLGAVQVDCPRALREPMKRMLSFPKAKAAVEEVNRQIGKIRIKLLPFSVSTQNAMWHPKSKSIILNSKRERNEGQIIRALLFEMHNAKNQKKFFKLDALAKRGKIGRDQYIREVEYIEYENVLETAALLEEGIAEGYYPESARYLVYSDFEQHYTLQRRVGHSQFIGQQYDKLVSA